MLKITTLHGNRHNKSLANFRLKNLILLVRNAEQKWKERVEKRKASLVRLAFHY